MNPFCEAQGKVPISQKEPQLTILIIVNRKVDPREEIRQELCNTDNFVDDQPQGQAQQAAIQPDIPSNSGCCKRCLEIH